jgi:hypothetical protein
MEGLSLRCADAGNGGAALDRTRKPRIPTFEWRLGAVVANRRELVAVRVAIGLASVRGCRPLAPNSAMSAATALRVGS